MSASDGHPGEGRCPRCTTAHHWRLPCPDLDLGHQRPGDPSPSASQVVKGRVPASDRLGLQPTVTSFGWRGKLLCTLPAYFPNLLFWYCGFFFHPALVLAVGTPMACFSLWWTSQVWKRTPLKEQLPEHSG